MARFGRPRGTSQCIDAEQRGQTDHRKGDRPKGLPGPPEFNFTNNTGQRAKCHQQELK